MFRLLALAAHFSPFNPGPFDPEVVALLNTYFEPEKTIDNVVELGGDPKKDLHDTNRSEKSKAA